MKRVLMSVLALIAFTSMSATSNAQSSASPNPSANSQAAPNAAPTLASRVPAPKSEDVNSLDAMLRAIYDVI